MRFQSNAEEIKYYMKELLNDGQEKTTQDIINYVQKMSNKKFTGGMLSRSN